MATLRNLAIGALKTLGADNIAKPPPGPSATSPNEHTPSWASPTIRTPTELDQALDRIQAELVAAEEEWQEWAVARRRVDAVLAPGADTRRRADKLTPKRRAELDALGMRW
jgi:hypothetical protein